MRLPPVHRVDWRKSARIVSSRFPTVTLYDKFSSIAELNSAYEIEGLTNERLLDELGRLSLVRPEDRRVGEGYTPIMAAFTHAKPTGTRFSDGSYGVYYAGRKLKTAIEETCFHQARFFRMSGAGPRVLEMRAYFALIQGDLHDLRGLQSQYPAEYDPDPDNYGPAQRLGRHLRDMGSWGIVYDSVRHPGGECAAILRPPVIRPVRQGPHFGYHFDGETIRNVTRLEHGLNS